MSAFGPGVPNLGESTCLTLKFSFEGRNRLVASWTCESDDLVVELDKAMNRTLKQYLGQTVSRVEIAHYRGVWVFTDWPEGLEAVRSALAVEER